MIDPYEILRVSPDATGPELKKAFHRLALECHPDSDPSNPWAENEFKELSSAYDLLSDPGRRRRASPPSGPCFPRPAQRPSS